MAATIAESVLSRILGWIVPPQRGQIEEFPLDLLAVPGLTTLLDVALFQSNEGQLTGTVVASHSLLATWLDVKRQSQIVLQLLKNNPVTTTSGSSHVEKIESFVRQALDAAMDAIERMSTDRLANAANLSDPFDSTASTTNSSGNHGHHSHHHHYYNYGGQSSVLSGIGQQDVSEGVAESKAETGRRRPMQRRKDCWESPRLHCPDYIWTDDVYQSCQRSIKSLDRHSVMDASRAQALHGSSGLFDFTTFVPHGGGSGGGSGGGGGYNRKNQQIDVTSAGKNGQVEISSEIGRQIRILVQLIEDDLPTRLYQFRQASETDAVVTKRLYLVKCEYRAPLRAFWDAHQSLLRAPPIAVVDSYLEEADWAFVARSKDEKSSSKAQKQATGNKKGASVSNKGSALETQDDLKKKLQSLLQTPSLTEMLTLEMEGEKLEVALGEALHPFSELARSLDQKRACLRVVPDVVEARELPALQETVRRLKFILCQKSGAESSSGIRPILLDLQLIPRNDEPTDGTAIGWLIGSSAINIASPFMNLPGDSSLDDRIDAFLGHLSMLSKLVEAKNDFSVSRNGDFDVPSDIIRGCVDDYDPELIRCQFLDWFTVVDRQHVLQKETANAGKSDDSGGLVEEIRLAELKISVSQANKASLKLVKERLETLRSDRSNRLLICKEMIEEVCLREMNLFVSLSGPAADHALELKETSAVGFLGLPLEMAGETLPIG
mmetsp:Transcript_37669/g.91622  ORF Transcript_37669/g.91622 Transcript_37669/m.91622 type:complete len:720 (+) Transcript_37669:1-2160(+)